MTPTPVPFNLPAAPPELCFDKNEFGRRTFSVDEFLHVHRNAATMETMRDNLGVYLKVLRSAMIELINEDYADFVNLASNLRGLDQQINGIQMPLQQLRADIVAVRTTLADTMADLTAGLMEKRQLRGELQAVRAVDSLEQRLFNIDALLSATDTNAGDNSEATVTNGRADVTTILERVAMEYAQVAFEAQQIEPDSVIPKDLAGPSAISSAAKVPVPNDDVADRTVRLNALHRRLLDALEVHFLQTLRATNGDGGADASSNNPERLERCLRIFCTLDECHVAETVFRKRVVAPHMQSIIAEQALQNSPQGVHGIYAQVLAFIEQYMRPLLDLTTIITKSVEGHRKDSGVAAAASPKVRGYDFLLRSFWTEVEQRLETHMSSIFAPGNPDQFYQKYESSVDFLLRVEQVLGTEPAQRAFKQSAQYRSFQTRWNLPVYFQIRFQEIGGALEMACSRPIGGSGTFTNKSPPNAQRLVVIATAGESFRRCWSTGVFLPQIFVRFWKFSLQILARTARWLEEFVALTDWPAQTEATAPRTLVDALIVCHRDVRVHLIDELPALLELVVECQRQSGHGSCRDEDDKTLLGDCLAETRRSLDERLVAIEKRVVDEIVAGSVSNIRQVNDIPRLFRKTNRDVPSKATPYVDQLLRTAVQFAGQHRSDIGEQRMTALLSMVFGQLNAQ